MPDPAEIERVSGRLDRAVLAATATRDGGGSFAGAAGLVLKDLVLLSSRLIAARLYAEKGIGALEGFPEYVLFHAESDAESLSDLLQEADSMAGEAILIFGSDE